MIQLSVDSKFSSKMEGSYNFKNIDKSLDDIIQRNSLTRPNFKAKNRKVDFRPRKSLNQIVKRARQDRKSAEAFVSKSMFISGLAPTVEQADLEQLFMPYGATVKMHFREDGKFIGNNAILNFSNPGSFNYLIFFRICGIDCTVFQVCEEALYGVQQETLRRLPYQY